MLHAGIEALFGRHRNTHQTKHFFRRHSTCKDPRDELSRFFADKPHLNKTLFHGNSFAFAALQGWRSTMEDKHKHLIPFDRHSWKSWAYFAIFDGHNGKDESIENTFDIFWFFFRDWNSEECIGTIGYSSIEYIESNVTEVEIGFL